VQTNEGTTATVVSMTEPATETGRFECYTDRRDQWRWRLCRADGQTLAICTKGHESREAATAEIDDIKRLTGQADVTDDPAA